MRGDFDEDEIDDQDADVCHHGVSFSEICEDCHDEAHDEASRFEADDDDVIPIGERSTP